MQTIATRFILSLACIVGLVGCDQDEDLEAKQLTFQEDALEPATELPGATELDANLEHDPYSSDNACKWHCKPCPPNKLCTQECYEIGNCNDDCGIIAKCIAGYVWSEQACNCIPDPNAGEPCGAVTCPSGTECCNSSCGMCVLPGNFCTQQVCDAVE